MKHVYHVFSVFIGHYVVLGVQNAGHVRMSDDFSFTLRLDRRDVHLEMLKRVSVGGFTPCRQLGSYSRRKQVLT